MTTPPLLTSCMYVLNHICHLLLYYHFNLTFVEYHPCRTFSMSATDLPYPAITICNKNGYDVGEYLRAVFDNFEYGCKDGDCEKSSLLRSHFPEYSSHKYIEASEYWIDLCHVDILAVSLCVLINNKIANSRLFC